MSYWKNADYVKREDEQFTPCMHNTWGIPDEKIIASFTDVPVVEMKYKYPNMLARVHDEVVQVIKAMNVQGKFVSKTWICHTLNFKERKADDIMVELKKQGLIIEIHPVRQARVHGTYYRLSGHKWTRTMQLVHARIRREMRVTDKRALSSSKKVSRDNKNDFSELPVSGVIEENNNGSEVEGFSDPDTEKEFSKVKKISLKTGKPRNHYPDGTPGDGRNGTCHSGRGCFERVTNPDNFFEYNIMGELVGMSRDGRVTPSVARSVCRRIDSGLISDETVAAVKNIIISKELSYDTRDLVVEFENILKAHTYPIRKEELSYIKDQINFIVSGSTTERINKDIKSASVIISHSGDTFERLIHSFRDPMAPTYAKLLAAKYRGVPEITLKQLMNEFKNSIYKQLAADKTAYNLFKNTFSFLDCAELDAFVREHVGELKSSLYVNKLSNAKLDNYYLQLTMEDYTYESECERFAGSCVGHSA